MEAKPTLTVLSWNIERGYKLKDIIEELRKADADILLLQELDISCQRTAERNVVKEIAEALSLNCVFIAEFEEYVSPVRSADNQGGGVHGNAILTKYDFGEVCAIPHTEVINWDLDGLRLSLEPRSGNRVSVFAEIRLPNYTVTAISCHLEPFVTCHDRFIQFNDVLKFCSKKYAGATEQPAFLIGGDFNTMLSGIGRFNGYLSRYDLTNYPDRFHHFGHTEAECFQQRMKNVLTDISRRHPEETTLTSLTDPFDKGSSSDWTLKTFYGLFREKLDWLLYSDNTFVLVKKTISTGNSSDHQYVMLDLEKKH